MKYWFDTEFLEQGYTKPLELISIGMVSEDGREFYAQNVDFDMKKLNHADSGAWLKQNVVPHLDDKSWMTRGDIASRILQFIGMDAHPMFWGFFADYDWVIFCQLFGRMVDLPRHFPMQCLDTKQLAMMFNVSTVPDKTAYNHNALVDAKWTKAYYEHILQRAKES